MVATHQPVTGPPLHARTKAPAGPASRRFGYTVAIVVNVILFVLVNDRPGWQSLSFLTEDFSLVLPLVNASLVAGIVANAVFVLLDPAWLRAVGDIVTTSAGLAAMVRLWQVFPFDFSETFVDLEVVARVVLAVGIAGSVIGIIAAVGRLVRSLGRAD
jgi:hypothetical protein